MEFKDLPGIAQAAACEVLKLHFPSGAVSAEQSNKIALRVRDAFIALYSLSESSQKNNDLEAK
ncbi:hypothetical protein [Limnobaculum xujianqingii]|uniref:hypothetical protein n=1 Tax=Limnobaculum xujianqingii TaxID=2738837 RepID=UPI001127C088|nr:hypothetical protein [Limnobaculum xujianqingii]